MVVTEYSSGDYKLPKISTGVIMKNPETLKFCFDHLKTKTMCKNAV